MHQTTCMCDDWVARENRKEGEKKGRKKEKQMSEKTEERKRKKASNSTIISSLTPQNPSKRLKTLPPSQSRDSLPSSSSDGGNFYLYLAYPALSGTRNLIFMSGYIHFQQVFSHQQKGSLHWYVPGFEVVIRLVHFTNETATYAQIAGQGSKDEKWVIKSSPSPQKAHSKQLKSRVIKKYQYVSVCKDPKKKAK